MSFRIKVSCWFFMRFHVKLSGIVMREHFSLLSRSQWSFARSVTLWFTCCRIRCIEFILHILILSKCVHVSFLNMTNINSDISNESAYWKMAGVQWQVQHCVYNVFFCHKMATCHCFRDNSGSEKASSPLYCPKGGTSYIYVRLSRMPMFRYIVNAIY